MKKKILITGGLGYLGTELCKLYSGESWYRHVTVLDKRFVSERVNQLRNWNINFVQGDILDKKLIKNLIPEYDIIFHLAGITDVAYVAKDSNSKQDEFIKKTAIDGTNNILNSMERTSKIIFPSTHVLYDGIKKTKKNIDESIKPRPSLAYSKSKYQNEIDIIRSKKNFIIFRLGSVYGYSTDTTRIGIMPNLFSKITALNGTIKLFSGGKQLKSLVPLIDVVRCFKHFSEINKLDNKIVNLVKDNVTVKDVAILCKKINPKVKIIETNDEIPNLGYTLSNKKLIQSGFKFLYNLENSIKEMIYKWSSKNFIEQLEYTEYGKKEFIDSRGKISNFELTEPINLIGKIFSKKYTIRANHFHPVQEQKCLVIKGQFISVIKNLLDKNSAIETRVVNEGEIVVTRPNVAHAMLFTKDTIFLNLVNGEREHENYGITHTIPYVLINEKLKKDLIQNYNLRCICCGKDNLKQFLSLGQIPLANNLLDKNNKTFDKYLLELNYCENCYNVQLTYNVNPKKLFKKYFYLSSTSLTFRDHFNKAAKEYIKKFKILKSDCILDIGSNDGIGLKQFIQEGYKKVYGVEPAKNLAKITKKLGIKTYCDFFSNKLAKKINKKFKLILASNVFAHSSDLDKLCQGVKSSLKKNGIFIIEVQYLINTLNDLTFDNIYHEHYNYWSIHSLSTFLKKFKLKIIECKKINTHGGSIRVYIKHEESKNIVHKSFNEFIKKEIKFGINQLDTFKNFAKQIISSRKKFKKNFEKIKKRKFVFYGAPAKATTKLNFYNIVSNEYKTIEDNNLKIGKYIPGTGIKIINNDLLSKKRNNIEIVIVLAWNFFKEIKHKYKHLDVKFVSIRDLEK